MSGRWGLTLPLPGTPLSAHEAQVKRAEAAGYTDLWSGETNGPDGFTPLALGAAWTERARLGTGIVGVFQRGPALLAQEAAALADASGGRFVLGIGSSSDRIVEGWNGIPFERPLPGARDAGVPAGGPRGRTHGERLQAGAAPAERVPIVLAALRGKMLELAVERAEGAFTNFLPLGGLPGSPRRAWARPRASSCSAASSACRASARRSSRWPASCSPPTSRCPSTPPSTAGSATASRSTRWSPPGRPATARPPPRGALGADRRQFVFGSPAQMRDRLDAFVAGG